jgi:hypothetical protein
LKKKSWAFTSSYSENISGRLNGIETLKEGPEDDK